MATGQSVCRPDRRRCAVLGISLGLGWKQLSQDRFFAFVSDGLGDLGPGFSMPGWDSLKSHLALELFLKNETYLPLQEICFGPVNLPSTRPSGASFTFVFAAFLCVLFSCHA